MSALADAAREALYLSVLLVAPPVGAALAAGLAVAVVQTSTQVQEQTIGFAVRSGAALLALGLCGPWIAAQLREFTAAMFVLIGALG